MTHSVIKPWWIDGVPKKNPMIEWASGSSTEWVDDSKEWVDETPETIKVSNYTGADMVVCYVCGSTNNKSYYEIREHVGGETKIHWYCVPCMRNLIVAPFTGTTEDYEKIPESAKQ